MATKKQIIEQQHDLKSQLYEVKKLVGLCSFAAEARRVLTEIDLAIEIWPDIGEKLAKLVDARNQWREHDDNLGLVLGEIDFKITAAIDLADFLES